MAGTSYWNAGAAAALALGLYLTWKTKLPFGRVLVALVLFSLALLCGARLQSIILEEGYSIGEVLSSKVWGGRAARLPGGWLASLLLSPLIAWIARVPRWSFLDIMTIAAAALFAVGRVACHATGCCIGTPTNLPWAISYDRGSFAYALHLSRHMVGVDASHSLPIHPLGLYMVIASLASLIIMLVAKDRLQDGVPALVGSAIFGLCFGSIELLRDAIPSGPDLRRAEIWFAVGIVSVGVLSVRLYRGRLWRDATRIEAKGSGSG